MLNCMSWGLIADDEELGNGRPYSENSLAKGRRLGFYQMRTRQAARYG